MAGTYNGAEKFLHRLALSRDGVGEAAFELEKLLYLTQAPDEAGRPVFVCGLARAGTTLLMRLFHHSGAFSSLTYRDMPFVMAPNFWMRLSRRSQKVARDKERAHGDGLLVGFDSPEALEEVFWRIHCRSQYLFSDHLAPMAADDRVIQEFRRYVRLVLLRHGGSRYLSKNNNNILRLETIRRAFPEAVICIPFRHPLHQARSLLSQHQRFCRDQAEDRFIQQYMGWLVHHEFGLDHRPPLWHPVQRPTYSTASINYWLSLWISTYRSLVESVAEDSLQVIWTGYEQLCEDPASTWATLSGLAGVECGLPEDIDVRTAVRQGEETAENIAAELVDEAIALYDDLSHMAAF